MGLWPGQQRFGLAQAHLGAERLVEFEIEEVQEARPRQPAALAADRHVAVQSSCGGVLSSLQTRTKKADVAEHPKGFNHVGLLYD